MKKFDHREIEEKWKKKWADAKIFEPEPDKRKAFYITVAYPYPSGGMHVGHGRTYTVPDIITRFERMQGFNVLFPMAWHVTGTPIIGALKRLKEGEEKQLRVLKGVYGLTDDEIKNLKEPMDFARYFIENHYLASMKALGYSIDWRRQFTTNDKHYNMFVTWQYKTLHKRGLVKKGLHPVKYCLKDKNPVTTHDLLEGENAEVQEFVLLKFRFGDSFIIAATLRPETVFGQTNMWVNPNTEYVKAKVQNENWIISNECAEKLKHQGKDVEIIGKVKGSELLGKYCMAPGIEREIIILPSEFCDSNVGSGLVTSVPSNAPYDWMGLKDLQDNKELCKKYGLNHEEIKKIKVIPIIKTDAFGDIAALKICSDMGIKSQKDTEKLEEATQIVYKEGFHKGVMNENSGKYKGMAVARAKEKVKQELLDEGKADTMLEFSEHVMCRCGGNVIVAKADSWFLDYANSDWKEVTKTAIEQLNTIPERTKSDYLHTVDWLHEWPCVRNFGLGTRLPFDDRFMIEPLSDSTIYMAYYTISHLLKELKPEQLTEEFFNFVFKNEGSIKEISEKTKISESKLKEIRESFDYWYPQDWRCSALELIPNHLTFMMYHHTALFNPEKWPKGIATFGMGLLNGQKMSSSKGNVILTKTAIEKHGADTVRLFLMSNAEPWQDFDWRENLVESISRKLKQFYENVNYAFTLKNEMKERDIDLWLLSRLYTGIKNSTEALEKFQTRKALQFAFFNLLNDWIWYSRRCEPNAAVVKKFAKEWIKLMAPFTPFLAEELWELSGEKGFVSNASYPVCDEGMLNPQVESREEVIRQLMEDIQKILEVSKIKPKTIYLYIAPQWKYSLYKAIKEGKTIRVLMQDLEIRKHGKEAAKLMQTRKEELPEFLFNQQQELELLESSKAFLEREFSCRVEIQKEPTHDPEGKSKYALPMKPGIYIEGS